jgi:hypothetical protein
MKALIMYDVSNNRHPELKNALKDVGFSDYYISSDKVTHYLPNTTLVIQSVMNLAHARQLFDSAISSLNSEKPDEEKITVNRFTAASIGMLLGIPGDPHA